MSATGLDLLPDPLLAILLAAPHPARDTLATVLTQGAGLASGPDTDPDHRLAIIAAWCAYQSLQTTSQDLTSDWLDQLTEAAIVLAGDALHLHLVSEQP